jgi:hypothetical protein
LVARDGLAPPRNMAAGFGDADPGRTPSRSEPRSWARPPHDRLVASGTQSTPSAHGNAQILAREKPSQLSTLSAEVRRSMQKNRFPEIGYSGSISKSGLLRPAARRLRRSRLGSTPRQLPTEKKNRVFMLYCHQNPTLLIIRLYSSRQVDRSTRAPIPTNPWFCHGCGGDQKSNIGRAPG